MQRLTPFFLFVLIVIAAASACNDEANHPSEPRLQGTYTATAFTVVTPDTVFDELAEGVSLTITLHPDGTTTGLQIVAEVVTDLSGEWDTTAGALRLHLASPSFLNRVAFAIAPNQLQGELLLESGAFHLTLTK